MKNKTKSILLNNKLRTFKMWKRFKRRVSRAALRRGSLLH